MSYTRIKEEVISWSRDSLDRLSLSNSTNSIMQLDSNSAPPAIDLEHMIITYSQNSARRADKTILPRATIGGYSAEVIEATACDNGPDRRPLITMCVRYPRFIHSEMLTHRSFARNAASSRAIPYSKMREAIVNDPVIPIAFGREQRGMITGDALSGDDLRHAQREWLIARDKAVESADALHNMGIHKSLCNRITEPWMWITVIITATEWANFFRLRCHPDAEVHMQRIAWLMRAAYVYTTPRHVSDTPTDANNRDILDVWHLPYVRGYDLDRLVDEYSVQDIARISAARCARVSYLTHDDKRDPSKDLELANKLANGSGFGHWSPHEHVGYPMLRDTSRSGPFVGFKQFRKTHRFENLEG